MSPTGAIALSAAVAFAASAAWIPVARRCGFVDPPGGRKDHGAPIPFGGGIAILVAYSVVAGIAMPGTRRGGTPFVESVSRHAFLFGALLAFGTGLIDDAKKSFGEPLASRWKFLGQAFACGWAAFGGIRFQAFGDDVLDASVAALWLLAATNAANFLDNMNGVTTGLGAIGAGAFLALRFPAREAQGLLGACLGFLPWNFPRARAFLGDAGSHLVGFVLGGLSILAVADRSGTLAERALPFLALAVPMLDLVRVVVVRLAKGRRPWIGDHLHVSHRLAVGVGRVPAVLILWGVAGVSGAAAVCANGRGSTAALAAVAIAVGSFIVAALLAPRRAA